jgi:hypothetical protein
MIAHPPIRQRRLRRPAFTTTRVTLAILVGLVTLSVLPFGGMGAWLIGYVFLVLATCVALRKTRRQPGSWLGRRVVRRGLVGLIAVTCVVLVATPAPSNPYPGSTGGGLLLLVVFLVVLNIALGGATQRVAAAPDSSLDERQEAVRNRAHRIAYVVFAAAVGGCLVVADVASQQTRSWLGSSIAGGGFVAFLELLFVLPAMVLAFLEPEFRPSDVREAMDAPRQSGGTRSALMLLTLTVGLPFLMSVLVAVLPPRTATTIQAPSSPVAQQSGAPSATTTCREFFARRDVGYGISAALQLHAQVCWDGRRAIEDYGMNQSDCHPDGTDLVTVATTQCTRTTDAKGTLAFTYRTDVASGLTPFLTRQVTLQLVVDRNGNVLQFP